MRKTLLLTLTTLLLGSLGTAAFASGSSGLSPVSLSEQDPLKVTNVMKCVVTRIAENGSVFVRDDDGAVRPLRFDDETHFVAQKRKDFDGRKKLSIEDLQVGQTLKVTYRPATQEVLRVKVRKQG